MSNFVINPYSLVPACNETTWEQTSYDSYYEFETNDIIGQFLVVDSSIVNGDPVTKVLFRINDSGGSSGTLSCCRWDASTTASFTNRSACNFDAADMLADANHTYWSVAASTLSAGWYGETQTSESTALSTGESIGLVMTDSGTDETNISQLDGVTSYSWVVNNNCGGSSPKNGSKGIAFSITTCG